MTASRHPVPELAAELRGTGPRYLELLRVPSLSAGIYLLARGAADDQTPHDEDEVYFVVSGRARLHVGERDLRAEPGDALFVPARATHRFVGIEEPLVLLVVFAPAEGTRSAEGPGSGKG